MVPNVSTDHVQVCMYLWCLIAVTTVCIYCMVTTSIANKIKTTFWDNASNLGHFRPHHLGQLNRCLNESQSQLIQQLNLRGIYSGFCTSAGNLIRFGGRVRVSAGSWNLSLVWSSHKTKRSYPKFEGFLMTLVAHCRSMVRALCETDKSRICDHPSSLTHTTLLHAS